MKRIMYISTLNADISSEDIDYIGQVSCRNNSRVGVTGILISAHEFFFQILEGDESSVDSVVDRIKKDNRHRDMLILKLERDVEYRIFPEWSMRTIQLDNTNDIILQTIRIMLENITESHRIIERYTQPSVLDYITHGINPLTIPVRKTERIIFFSDMVGFSVLSEIFPVEEVADIVNQYLEVCTTTITRNGGTVTKYVGDCVMAHFDENQTDAAIKSAFEVIQSVSDIRRESTSCQLGQFLYCGIGISKGQVIEGNFGSSIKMDYTVLGNTVNIAARLQTLTRVLSKAIAISSSVRETATMDWSFASLGEFELKGHEKLHKVFTLDYPVVNDFPDQNEIFSKMQNMCGRLSSHV